MFICQPACLAGRQWCLGQTGRAGASRWTHCVICWMRQPRKKMTLDQVRTAWSMQWTRCLFLCASNRRAPTGLRAWRLTRRPRMSEVCVGGHLCHRLCLRTQSVLRRRDRRSTLVNLCCINTLHNTSSPPCRSTGCLSGCKIPTL